MADAATNKAKAPRWMSTTLHLAGIYNLVWGLAVVLFPEPTIAFLTGQTMADMKAAADNTFYGTSVVFWQTVGMIVGVYGIGYWVAASDPLRHWPIVLVGALGKLFGPIGFVDAVLIREVLSPRFGLTIITNDLIWWVPFWWMLWRSYQQANASRHARLLQLSEQASESDAATVADVLASTRTASGRSLADLSREQPLVIVFLRHFGCTFCRETLKDLARQRDAVERAGMKPVFVHMLPDAKSAEAEAHFARYDLPEFEHVGDPDKTLYDAFELGRGSLQQLFGLRVWLRGIDAGILGRHFVGKLAGDGFQMPGAFIVKDSQIVRAFRHEDAADRPDYAELCTI